MYHNKIIFNCFILFFLLAILFSMQSNVYAISDELIGSADDFINIGKSNQGNTIDEDEMKETSDNIYNMLLAFGIFLAVTIALVLGIQFMTGSLETQAKVKESLIPFIVGCVIIFGAFGIWKAVVLLGNKL